jgi:Glycosyl transferase family 2
MRVVETLVVRDEADIVEGQITYHLNAGVDFVIATDHGSEDGTTDILESFARGGYLHRIVGEGPTVLETEWRTRMARLAATEYGADWVMAADADEFWVPRTGSIKDVLAAVPDRFGIVGGVICHFVPRPDDGASFAERMVYRLVQQAPVNDPTSPMRPSPKSAFRADPEVQVLHAAYWIESPRLRQLPGWCPFDVFHFPCRSLEQWSRKTARRGHADADKQLGQYVKGLQAQERGEIDDVYSALVVDDSTLEHGLELGVLVEDLRLREALRPGAARIAPSGSTDPTVDVFSLDDSTVVRLRRRVDDASARLHGFETRRRFSRAERGSRRRSTSR